MEEGWETFVAGDQGLRLVVRVVPRDHGRIIPRVVAGDQCPLGKALVGVYGATQQGIDILETPFRLVEYAATGSRRVADLEHRLAQMAVDREILNQLTGQNEQLKTAVEQGVFKTVPNLKMVTTMVWGQDKGILGIGADSGVSVGQVVLSTDGVLVGRVVKVGRYSGVVLRPNDWNSQIAVRLLGKTTNGVLTGDGTGAHLVGILQADSIEAGDILVTSGTDEIYPEGLVVGQVADVSGVAADVTKEASVTLLAKPLATVVVLKGK